MYVSMSMVLLYKLTRKKSSRLSQETKGIRLSRNSDRLLKQIDQDNHSHAILPRSRLTKPPLRISETKESKAIWSRWLSCYRRYFHRFMMSFVDPPLFFSRSFSWALLRANSCVLQLRVFCFHGSSPNIVGPSNKVEGVVSQVSRSDVRGGTVMIGTWPLRRCCRYGNFFSSAGNVSMKTWPTMARLRGSTLSKVSPGVCQ